MEEAEIAEDGKEQAMTGQEQEETGHFAFIYHHRGPILQITWQDYLNRLNRKGANMTPHIPDHLYRPSFRYQVRAFFLAVPWPPVWLTVLVLGAAAICLYVGLVIL